MEEGEGAQANMGTKGKQGCPLSCFRFVQVFDPFVLSPFPSISVPHLPSPLSPSYPPVRCLAPCVGQKTSAPPKKADPRLLHPRDEEAQ